MGVGGTAGVASAAAEKTGAIGRWAPDRPAAGTVATRLNLPGGFRRADRDERLTAAHGVVAALHLRTNVGVQFATV
jgi:hypothetical protein